MPLSQVIPNPGRDDGLSSRRRTSFKLLRRLRPVGDLSRARCNLLPLLHRHRGRIPTPRKNRINLNPIIALDEGLGYRAVEARIVRELPRTPRAQPDGIDGGRATLVALERYPGQGSRMIQIDVDVPDRPGELAKLAAILGATGINIDAISAESAGGRSYMSLIVNQPMQAREALMKNGYASAMRTVLVVRLDDKPGALASLARKLGDSGVDVVSLIHLGTVGGHAQIALGVDNLEKARSLV